MKIFVRAKPNSREEGVEKVSGNVFIVRVKEPPVEGRANEALARVLAEYFGVAVSRVKIKAGQTGRQKLVEIE